MGKTVQDAVLDAALEYVADAGDRLFVCSTEPTNYTEASSTYMLAQHTMTEGVAGADYSKANGDTSGRKLTVAQQADISITNTGTAAHVCIADSVGSVILIVTTCTSQALTAGNTVTVPAWDMEIADPT